MRRGRPLTLLTLPALSLSLLGGSCGSNPSPSPSPSSSSSPSPSPSATPVTCTGTPSTYARTVSEWWIPRCSLDHNIYNDPQTALGPPDAAGSGPESYSGFISLGFGGRVTVGGEVVRGRERERQRDVAERVVAGVLERGERHALARAGDAADEDEVHRGSLQRGWKGGVTPQVR